MFFGRTPEDVQADFLTAREQIETTS
jgi:hypothetical protein